MSIQLSYPKVLRYFLIFSVVLLSLSLCQVYAEGDGIIKGKVTDKKSGEVLPGVSVTVEGTDIMAFTDEKGEFEIDIQPGTYKLMSELLGFKVSNATNVVVVEGEKTNVNFPMEEEMAFMGEEVVVTGEKLTVPLSKTTASVSVVSSSDLEKITVATNASDLIMNTPGVQVESGGSEFSKTIKIRGRTVAPPKVASSGILLLIDGVPSNDPGSGYANVYQIPSENIERIEILKGASSAQYGGQAAAGVINIITKKGQIKPVTKVSTSFGTYQRRRGAERELIENYSFFHSWGNKYFNYALSGAYSHQSGMTTADRNPVGNAYRLFGASNPNDNRRDDGTKILPNRKDIPYRSGDSLNKLMDDGDRDKGERYSVGLNLGIELFKNNTLRINPSYSFLDFYTPFSPGDIPIIDDADTFLQFFLRVINRRDSITIADKWDITPKLTYNFRLGLIKSTDVADFIFVNDYIDYTKEEEAKGNKDQFSGENKIIAFNSAPDFILNRSFDMANELSYKFDVLDGMSFLVGHEYAWSKSISPGSYTVDAPKRTTNSFFFQNMVNYRKFTFSVGGRWDQMTTLTEDFNDEFSPRFGINYLIKPGTSLRFSVGRARRFPEYARQYGFAQSAGKLFGNPELGPEINWTYELGFLFTTKYVSGDIAYFYDDYSDFEIPIPVSVAGFVDGGDYTEKVFGIPREQFAVLDKDPAHPRAHFFVNGPDVIYQGFDTSFDLEPIKDWNINLSYLFQRGTVGNRNPFDFRQGTAQSLFLDIKGKAIGPKFQGGNRIIYVPTHIFKVGSDYTLPFGLNVSATGRFKSTVKFVSAVYPGGIFNEPEHWIWDLKFTQPLFDEKIKLTFAIENVFSKLYYESGGIPSNVARYVLGVSATF